MQMNDFFMVAAYQGPVKEGDSKNSLDVALETTHSAEQLKVDILCFPETFLHGYFSLKQQAMEHSIDLNSIEFSNICQRFSSFHHTTVLLGLNEREDGKIYNTVVVIENGKFLGKYRKAYTYVPYNYYSLGHEFPVFSKKGIK